MDSSYDPETGEEIDSLKGTTATYPAGGSTETPPVEQNDAADDQDDEPATPRWRRLTVTLSAAGIDSLPDMVIQATHPTYSVSELPVTDTGRCTLWLPETVDTLNIVLSFPATEQDDITVTDIVVEEQETITIPIVILSEEL
ncbi:hypothetical protein [Halocatena salina]|uniref:Uncharacterized protein n=1 Tax=Halocatena salina TaxID=2934340 RepID=A0A8U0A8V3_9EURY|nr:hypothetical protein [Halocatena salina]UPM44453.1 hypothetical protein MW046_13485 [Halocatena salina]